MFRKTKVLKRLKRILSRVFYDPWVYTIIGGLVVVGLGVYIFENNSSPPVHEIKVAEEVIQDEYNPAIGIYYPSIQDKFIQPTFKNISENNDYIEYIYVEDSRILQIIVNEENIVDAHSITKNQGETVLNQYGFNLVLGKSTVYDLGSPAACYGFVGANGPTYYFEEHYLGRPGKYLYYYVGSVFEIIETFDDLTPIYQDADIGESRYKPLYEYPCEDIQEESRKAFVVTTIMYSRIPIKYLPFLPGPNTDALGLLSF